MPPLTSSKARVCLPRFCGPQAAATAVRSYSRTQLVLQADRSSYSHQSATPVARSYSHTLLQPHQAAQVARSYSHRSATSGCPGG